MSIYIPGKPIVKEPKDLFIQLVSKDFDTRDWDTRLLIIADTNHFKYKEDESVWLQATERIPNIYEVYFDNVWVCDFTDDDAMPTVRLRFLKAFLQRYEAGEVSLNTQKELIDHDVESTIDKALREIKASKPQSEEEHIQNEVITELLEDKKKPKKVNSLKQI